ncbi:MAG: hypothetical protein RL497_2468, partial [Pseudomonadota bacterium]
MSFKKEIKIAAWLKTLACLIALTLAAVNHTHAVAPSFDVILGDALPGEIRSFLQDRHGYIWFGGRNALLRYNAYKYQSIFAQEQKGTELKNISPYYVSDIIQDSAGTLWIASHSGLFYFDENQEILVRPTAKDGTLDPFFLSPLQDIAELPTGEMLIGGDGAGLAVFDKNSFNIQWRQINNQEQPQAPTAIAERTIQRILVDTQKRIWVANNKGLNLFDFPSKSFSLFIPNPENPTSKADNALIAMAEDKTGNILGGTLGKGLYQFDTQKHQFRNYKNDPTNPSSLPDDTIWSILIDSENKIWLGHARSGFSWFNQKTHTFTSFNYTYGQPGALAYSAIRSIYEDNNKNIWIGHFPGKVSFHDYSTEQISIYRKSTDDLNAISDNNVQRVMEDKNNTLWVTVGDGVNALDRKTEKFKRYSDKLGNYPAHGSLSGYIDKNDTVWIGTWTEGFFRLNKTTDHFEAMPFNAALAASKEKHSNTLNDATIWSFCETQDNTFWVGTHYAGINRYDVGNGVFTKYKDESSNTSLSNNIVWTCFEDSKKRFWIGTSNGLNLMDRNNETFKSYKPQENKEHGLKSGSVGDIYEDAQGRVWFATNAGLHRYREESDDFEVFTTEHGFDNNGLRALTGDRAGNLWLGTNNGIIQFNPDTRKVKNYLIVGGQKLGGVNAGAALTSTLGEVVFGTTDGLVIIDSEKLTTNKMPPPVVITDFKIFARSASLNDADSVLKKVINHSENITLDYTKRMFSFEFSALNYRDADKNKYAYMLEGFDQDWREIGHAREAQYTNLSPGKYIFKVRASNNDDVWMDEPKSIVVIQLPPPWKTWWAYTAYILLGLLAIAYLVYLQKRKQRLVEEQNRLLEIKVIERTKDLAEKNKDIQSLLGSMQQGLFTIEEGGLVHPEYSVFLESIFETQSIAGRDVMDVLFEHATLDDDTKSQVESSIHSIIGSDEINYDLNAHLLINEYHLALKNNTKIISLDWSPIFDGDTISKLMVSVRDVTAVKALELEASIKKRELDILAQLLAVNTSNYVNYYDSTVRYLDESKHLLEHSTTLDDPILAKIFRNLHTVKGNSRTQGFNHIASATHEAENCLERLREDVTCGQNKLTCALEDINSVLMEYNTLYVEVLKRNKNSERNTGGVWMSTELVEELKKQVESIKQIAPESHRSIWHIINTSSAASLDEILSPVLESLPALAAALGKTTPRVIFNDPGVK